VLESVYHTSSSSAISPSLKYADVMESVNHTSSSSAISPSWNSSNTQPSALLLLMACTESVDKIHQCKAAVKRSYSRENKKHVKAPHRDIEQTVCKPESIPGDKIFQPHEKIITNCIQTIVQNTEMASESKTTIYCYPDSTNRRTNSSHSRGKNNCGTERFHVKKDGSQLFNHNGGNLDIAFIQRKVSQKYSPSFGVLP